MNLAAPTASLSPLVLAALESLHIRCDGDVLTTAWRLAVLFCTRWTFESRYQRAAWMALAIALAAGDDVAAEGAALWLVHEDAAMDTALASVRAQYATATVSL